MKVIALFLIIQALITTKLFAQVPGLMESYQEILKVAQKEYDRAFSKVRFSPSTNKEVDNLKNLRLSPYYLQLLILHADKKWFELASGQNICDAYRLISSEAISSPRVSTKVILGEYQGKQSSRELVLLKKKQFIESLLRRQCPELYKAHLSLTQNRKSILTTIRENLHSIPNKPSLCLEYLKKEKQSNYLPYLCQLQKNIAQKEDLKKILKRTRSFKEKDHLINRINLASYIEKNLSQSDLMKLSLKCDSIKNSKNFCNEHQSDISWKKISTSFSSSDHLINFCKRALKRKKLGNQGFIQCLELMDKKPETCYFMNGGDKALFPAPDCHQLARALKIAKIKAPYNDCPAYLKHHSFSSLSRISQFFNPIKISENDCLGQMGTPIQNIAVKTDFQNIWQTQICHTIKQSKTDKCYPTSLSLNSGRDSISQIVSKLVNRHRAGNSSSVQCKAIKKIDYRRSNLKYAAGCFIIVDTPNCSFNTCSLDVIINNQKFEGIYLKGDVQIEYLASNYRQEGFSLSDILVRSLEKRTKTVLNFRLLKDILDNHPKSLVHGLGCIEDILPQFFERYSLNQCSVTSFVIDGHTKVSNEKFFMSIRTGMDGVQSPRLVSWNRLYEALRNYQAIHRVNKWSLYAIY